MADTDSRQPTQTQVTSSEMDQQISVSGLENNPLITESSKEEKLNMHLDHDGKAAPYYSRNMSTQMSPSDLK